MWWATGVGLSSAGWVGRGREHDTVRPDPTLPAAAAVTSAVTKFRAPSWSSSPHRPQLDSFWWRASTSSVVMGGRDTNGTVPGSTWPTAGLRSDDDDLQPSIEPPQVI